MTPDEPRRERGEFSTWTILGPILVAAAAVRLWNLGGLSFWYDEVVSMTLARTPSPAALLTRLGEIDATRAPLHPLLLQVWLELLGGSEAAGRSLSAVCGLATVALVARIGTRLFDSRAVGLWAAALAAVSPPLVAYAREVRMYAWLVLTTCLAWDALIGLTARSTRARVGWYALTLMALGYSHSLGLLMWPALGLVAVAFRERLGLARGRWIWPHAAALVAVGAWIPRYLDHAPESMVGLLPLKFLLGLPIGFVGGNFLVLGLFLAVILAGLRNRDGRGGVEQCFATTCLLAWLAIPPLILYGYSRVAHPIFGPERYTLYVAPAYLILLARGLERLPRWPRVAVAALALGLATSTLPTRVFAPDAKADWRTAAAWLDATDVSSREPVVVASGDPAFNVEVVTARYYLGARPTLPMPEPPDAATLARALPPDIPCAWLAIGARAGIPARALPDDLIRDRPVRDFNGLRLHRLDPPEAMAP